MSALLSWRPAELPNSWASEHGWTLARLLIVLAIAVTLGYAVLARASVAARVSDVSRRRIRKLLFGLLGLAATGAILTYVDFGVFRYGTYLNEWDFYHYYIGTKYAPELGYTHLYSATLLADAETGLRYHNPDREIRDLGTAELRDVSSVIAEAPSLRARFDDDRWHDFVEDIRWFKMQLPVERWSLLLVDHGYNGTPAWSFVVGGLLTNHLSVRNPVSRALMLALDPMLLLAGVAAVAWAFGLRQALLLVVFIGTHYLLSWGHLKGALLRTDFAMCALLSVCLVKKGYYKVAGALLGWATLSRVFPGMLLIGPAVLMGTELVREHRLNRSLASLFVAFAATVALVMSFSLVHFGGTDIWHEWSQKILLHYAGGSDWDLGYRTIAEAKFVQGVPVRGAWIAAMSGESVSMLDRLPELIVLVLLGLPALTFARFLEHHEAIAYGFVFIFLFSLATYYYYLVLCVPFVFFVSDVDRLQHALGVSFMLFTGLAGYVLFSGWAPLRDAWVLFRGWHQTFPTYFFISCLIAVTVVQMMVLAASKARRLEGMR
jgi:hypothetical protein